MGSGIAYTRYESYDKYSLLVVLIFKISVAWNQAEFKYLILPFTPPGLYVIWLKKTGNFWTRVTPALLSRYRPNREGDQHWEQISWGVSWFSNPFPLPSFFFCFTFGYCFLRNHTRCDTQPTSRSPKLCILQWNVSKKAISYQYAATKWTGRSISKQVLEGLKVMHQQGDSSSGSKACCIVFITKHLAWVCRIKEYLRMHRNFCSFYFSRVSYTRGFLVVKPRLAQGTTTLHTQVWTQVYSDLKSLGLDSSGVTLGHTNSVDICSLGCVIYELFVGTNLFPSEGQVSRYYSGKWLIFTPGD